MSGPIFNPYSLASHLPTSSHFFAQEQAQSAPDELEARLADDFAKAEGRTPFESFLAKLSGKESHDILEDGGALGAAVDALSPWSFGEMEALRGNEPSYFAKKFLEKRDKTNNSEKLSEIENAYQAAYKKYLIKDILSHSKPDSPKYEVLSKYAKEELLIGKKPWQFWKMTPEKSARFWMELPLNLVFCFLGGLASKGVGPRVTSALTKMLGPALTKVLGPSLAKFLAPSLAKTFGFTAETGVFSHSVGIMDGAKNLLVWQDASYFETLRKDPKGWAKADLNSWAMAGGGIAAFKYSGAVYYKGIGRMIPKQRFVNLIGSTIVATPLVTAATGFESELLGHAMTAEENSEAILSNVVFSLGLGGVEFVRPAKKTAAQKSVEDNFPEVSIETNSSKSIRVIAGLYASHPGREEQFRDNIRILENIAATGGDKDFKDPEGESTIHPRYFLSRGLDIYTGGLPGLEPLLQSAGVYVDIGAGEAVAMRELAQINQTAELIAISKKQYCERLDLLPDNMKYLAGNAQEIVPDLIKEGTRPDVITDYYGAFTFSIGRQLDLLEMYFDFLSSNGKAFIRYDADHIGVFTRGGELMLMSQWLNKINHPAIKIMDAPNPAGPTGKVEIIVVNKSVCRPATALELPKLELVGTASVEGDAVPFAVYEE